MPYARLPVGRRCSFFVLFVLLLAGSVSFGWPCLFVAAIVAISAAAPVAAVKRVAVHEKKFEAPYNHI